MDEPLIRQAAEADLPDLLRLYAQLSLAGHVVAPNQAQAILTRIARYPDYRVYVAVQGGRVVGTFGLLILDQLGHGGQPSGIVESVVVSRDCRGQGIGKRMMRFAMDRCRQANCYKLALSSNLKRGDAHAFYESLGFVRHGYSFEVAL